MVHEPVPKEFSPGWMHTNYPPVFPDLDEAVTTNLLHELHDEPSPAQAPKMPLWTTQDTRNAVVSSLIPAGAAATAFVLFARDQHATDWWASIRKPNWAPTDVRVYSAVDLLSLSPLGYASYLVFKNGGGFDYTDTRLALGLYGANLALALTTIPIVKKKNLSCLWKNTALVHLTAAGAAFAFYKIDKTAGLLLIPYALWTGVYAYLAYSIHKENEPVKDL